jgi:hypothetical protein
MHVEMRGRSVDQMRATFAAALLVLMQAGVARAGGFGDIAIGIVNLDQDAGSKRFEKLVKAFDKRPGASPFINKVVVVPKADLGSNLREKTCDLASAGDYSTFRTRANVSGLILYCSSGGAEPSITIAFYGPNSFEKQRLKLQLDPRSGTVGHEVFQAYARLLDAWARAQFQP